MSLPQNNFHHTSFSGFDNSAFDEDVLFDDYSLTQEQFVPENPDEFETQKPSRDELYEDVRETADESIVLKNQSEDQKEPHFNTSQEEPDALKTLTALDILLHPPMDVENNAKPVGQTGVLQLDDPLMPEIVPTSVNINSLTMIEEPFVNSAGPPEPNALNFATEVQNATGVSVPQAPELSLPISAAALQNEEVVDVQSPNMDLALLNSMMEEKIHPEPSEGGPPPAAFLDICEGSFTPGMLQDIFKPASDEGNPTLLDMHDANATQMPSPKRRRKVGRPPIAFSEPANQSLKRSFVNLESSNQGHASVDGSERRKKRTRTRIEDMDPSMVHVCKFPGCTKKFAKKYNLKIHQRRHNGDLPFLCEYAGCAKRFMWLSSFSRHLRVHETQRNGGRRKREVQVESEEQQTNDAGMERGPDIAISENFSIFSVSGVKLFIENELSEDVTFACALTALDSRPCESLIPIAQTAQAKRQQLLWAGRSEDFYQQQTIPYDKNNAHLRRFCQLVAVASDLDGMVDDSIHQCPVR